MGAPLFPRSVDHDGEHDNRDGPVVEQPIDEGLEIQKDSASELRKHIHKATSGKAFACELGSGRIIIPEIMKMQGGAWGARHNGQVEWRESEQK